MKNIFKPEMYIEDHNKDFPGLVTLSPSFAAERSWEILSDYLEKEGVRVYGFSRMHGWFKPDTESNHDATHTALLINIEPIVKEKCSEHRIIRIGDALAGELDKFKCSQCGVELKQMFIAVEEAE